MKNRRTLAVLCGLLLAAGALVLPTQAHAAGVYQQVAFDPQGGGEWAFQATVNGDHLCLDDGNGAAGTNGMFGPHPQADVWHCSVGTAPLLWHAVPAGGDMFTFAMVSAVPNGGCLDNFNGGASNGNPLWMFGPTCVFDSNQLFRLWSIDGGQTAFLVPAQFSFDPSSTPVVSIAGPAGNGALIQLWHAGANSSLQKLVSWHF